MAVYERMWGPNEFTMTGAEKDYDLTDRLGALTVPVLFLCGRFDEARPEDTAFFHGLVRDAELVVLEQSSHNPHFEEPQRYFPVVRDFLQRAERARHAAGAGRR